MKMELLELKARIMSEVRQNDFLDDVKLRLKTTDDRNLAFSVLQQLHRKNCITLKVTNDKIPRWQVAYVSSWDRVLGKEYLKILAEVRETFE